MVQIVGFLRLDMKNSIFSSLKLSRIQWTYQTHEQRLAKTRQIKQGMMQELIKGRTRLLIGYEQ